MQQFSHSVQSRQSAEKLYSLVNDTDSYKLYIPYCQDSRVLHQVSATEKKCLLSFSYMGIDCNLVTINHLILNQRIEVSLAEGPFSMLEGVWTFDNNDEGCLVSLTFQYAFENAILGSIFKQVFNRFSDDMIRIFCERADR